VLIIYLVSLFLSAALMFLVQPMFGKMALPLLGGSPAVWNTQVVFCQGVLLCGYLYAHLTSGWLGIRRQKGPVVMNTRVQPIDWDKFRLAIPAS